jgi:hypothetical protein
VEVVPLEAAAKYLDKTSLPHLLLDGRVGADVEEDVETDIEELILLPDEDIQLLQLRPGRDSIILIVSPPHLDVLAVHKIESLDLVFEDLNDGGSHFVFGEDFLKLLVVGEYVESGEDIYAKVDASLVIFAQRAAQD